MTGCCKRDLPQGPCWRRYNHDGYGQKEDGGAFDGTGVGRSWPILTGERGHYELAAGRDPLPFIKAMEAFANEGGMISEQLWDADDLPNGKMKRGQPTGAAMPLCWSHAEYISLVRSRHDGVCFDRIEPAFQRYVAKPVTSRHEMWTLRHQIRQHPTQQNIAGHPCRRRGHYMVGGPVGNHQQHGDGPERGAQFVVCGFCH